ncbi:putative permease, DMT superfamily [Sphaerochaeta pleomorpha str. Grapes]|uniref:Putative permease, DMT superfamily n=1 Tax=Sphaerochaeta pleomorpha (strain ATCC BAA-1885 / DSM 22778 / Grapes) TaxID=158190 RepID=G8QS54_SPHPG|nr:DMT family transporter [Sphaerochaeta pleomorpha]AEV28915.1 putative permease, DMT superfamily [Sphaerochaeta pleomorpha str. Grapes]
MIRYRTGIALTLISSCFFGLMGLFNRIALEGGVSLFERITLRFFLASLILFALIKIQGKKMALPKGFGLRLILSSSLFFGGTSFFLFYSYLFIPTSLTTTLHFTYPLLILGGNILLDGARPSLLQKIGTALSIAGLLFALRPGSGDQSINSFGIFLALASAVTFLLYVRFLSKKESKDMDNTVLMFYVLLFSALAWSFPTLFLILKNGHGPLVWSKAIVGLLGLAVPSTALACTFFSLGVRSIGSDKASILSVFEPLTSILAGVVLLGEKLPSTFALGAFLILCGSYLVSKSKSDTVCLAPIA